MLKTKTDKNLETALATPSIENLEVLIGDDPRWERLSVEQQGLIQLLLGQNSLSEGQDLLQEQLKSHLQQLLHYLQFDLDLKTPEFLGKDAQTTIAGSAQWLTYTSRQAHLVGRDDSLSLLDDFIDQDDDFSWWVVSGVGGVGKSRLALEALLRHDYLWEVGFLHSRKLQKPDALSQWQPKSPTFIVIDYAVEYVAPIADWIDHLIQHQSDYDFPVRLLILERETKAQRWWEHLTSGSSDALRRQQKLFMPEPHELSPLTNQAHQVAVLQNFLQSLKDERELPDFEDSFWQTLKTITDQGRPLFIGMAALAIQQHDVHHLKQWHSQHDLLEEMLTREKKLWQQQLAETENQPQMIQLFALSTVVAGFDWNHQEEQIINSLIDLGLLDHENQAEPIEKQLITLAGHQGGYLQPDLLAEYFVLQQWGTVRQAVKKRLLSAYQLAPKNTLAFIERCAVDYPENNSSWLWWEGLKQTLSDQDQLAALYTTAFGIIGQLDLQGKYRLNLQYWLVPLCQLKDPQQRAKATNWKGLQYYYLGEGDKALEQYQIALPIQQKIGDKSGEGTTLNNMAGIYIAKGDYETALTYLKQSLDIQQEIGDKSDEGATLNNISQIFKARGDYETALSYLKQSLDIRQEIGDKSGEGTTLNNISQIYYARGDYETALSYLKQSLDITQEIGDKSGEGTTLNNISQIFKARSDYETALSYLKQSLDIQQEIGDKSGEGATLNNMATTAHARGDYETALTYLKQSLDIRQEIGDKSGEGTTLNNISQIYDARGDYETALTYLKQSLDIQQEIGDQSGMCTTLFNIGHIHWQNEEKQKAYSAWIRVYQMAKPMGLAQVLDALENLAKWLDLEGGLAAWEQLAKKQEKDS